MTYSLGHTSGYGNVTLSVSGAGYSSPYTLGVSNGTSATDLIWSGATTATWTTAPVTISQKATIDLKGEEADIVINGESLKETLQAIKDALKIPGRIQQDAKLEESFEELKEIRKQYEQKLKEYKEKEMVWDTLKSQDQ